MKRFLLSCIALWGTMQCFAQGTFLHSNPTAPTRLWSIDGPLAGPTIWSQMLAGATPALLAPVGIALRHDVNGIAGPRVSEVPGVLCLETAYFQMVAWDGTLWGSALDNVPNDQLGRTDIVPRILAGCFNLPNAAPAFTQPAVVPVPEPSAVGLLLLLTGALGCLRMRRARGVLWPRKDSARPSPIRRLNGAHAPTPYSPPLEKAVVPNPDTIAQAIRELMAE